MKFIIDIPNTLLWFCVASGIAFILSIFMEKFGKHLRTRIGTFREFGILDLEFPSNCKEIPSIINGIKKLPEAAQQTRVRKSLLGILYLDFLFMPAIYGALFLICMLVAVKSHVFPKEQYFFAGLAWAQLLAWACDIFENICLLWCLRKKDLGAALPQRLHLTYIIIVWVKWAIALIGGVSAFMMLVYFWLKGNYNTASLNWLGIFIGAILLSLIIRSISQSKKKEDVILE
jgi:hypothetical protein